MNLAFTAHNIRLGDGSRTKPEAKEIEQEPVFLAAKRALEIAFPGDKRGYRIADLGCLEGGYSVEFARMGFDVLGLEVRGDNMARCDLVKSQTDLPNLRFVHDDCWNIHSHGTFDAIFCCGLLYHLDRPREYLHLLSLVTRRLLILQTHFAGTVPYGLDCVPRPLRRLLPPSIRLDLAAIERFRLGPTTTNEGLTGRWFTEFANGTAMSVRSMHAWASWDNVRSFWIERPALIGAIQEAGFGFVAEQFDHNVDAAAAMTNGYYRRNWRGMFLGVKA